MENPLFSMHGDRVRQVISRSMPQTRIRFASRKSGRTLHAESQLEAFLMMRLELDPNVLRFREQPGTIRVPVGSRQRKYTPDIYAEQINGNFVYEVKPEKKVPQYADLFEATEGYLAGHGYRFVVVTDTELRREPALSNQRLLLRYAAYPIPPKVFQIAKAILVSTGGCSIGSLADAIQLHGGSLHAVYSLIARGYASAATDNLLCTNTIATWR